MVRGAATALRRDRPLHHFAVPLPRCAGEDQQSLRPVSRSRIRAGAASGAAMALSGR